MRLFRVARVEERADVHAAFITLFGLIGSHSILETARDALFLAKIPAERLPVVYIFVAGVSLFIARLQQRFGAGLDPRFALSLWTALAGGITIAFRFALPFMGDLGLYALYIWSGVLTTLVLVYFWTVLGDLFSVTRAKRLYGIIGAGSVVGAIVGSALARVLAEPLGAEGLVLVAGVGLVLTAFAPRRLTSTKSHRVVDQARRSDLISASRRVVRDPYLRWIAGLALLSAVTLTVGDFLFKRAIAEAIPADELGAYFATVYLALNVLSFVAQVFLVDYLIRRFDLSAALMILPVAFVLGGLAMAVAGGLVAAWLIKGPDGTLRYSLHRTATELSFVPLSQLDRAASKPVIDVVGQKGGQALGSVLILGLAAAGANDLVFGLVLTGLALLWVVLAVGIRGPYLAVFRRRIAQRVLSADRYRDLDVPAMERLLMTLNSPDDLEVVAVMDQLEQDGRARAVPGLILYHPSERVVLRALRLFARAGHLDLSTMAERLIAGEVPAAKAAGYGALPASSPALIAAAGGEDQVARAAAVVRQLALSNKSDEAFYEALEPIALYEPQARKAALVAIEWNRDARFDSFVLWLSASLDPGTRLAAIETMGNLKRPAFIDSLITALATERTRAQGLRALMGYGDEALEALEFALGDTRMLPFLRWQLPGAIALFNPTRAAIFLSRHLVQERDGLVRFRCLRALERIVLFNPAVRPDRVALRASMEATVSRSYRLLDRRVALVQGAKGDSKRQTPGHELLIQMLMDKEQHTRDRLLRLLALLAPDDDLERIRRGLRSRSGEGFESAIELLANALRPPLRGPVVALFENMPCPERLSHAGVYHTPRRLDYIPTLRWILGSSSDGLVAAASHHVGELGLWALSAELVEVSDRSLAARDAAAALRLRGLAVHA